MKVSSRLQKSPSMSPQGGSGRSRGFPIHWCFIMDSDLDRFKTWVLRSFLLGQVPGGAGEGSGDFNAIVFYNRVYR